jgi:hypothetical protein
VQRRVQLDVPTRAERAEAGDVQLPSAIYDLPDSDYKTGDVITILSRDGHTSVPDPATFVVGTVDRLPAPLALTRVELGVTYNPQTG